MIIILNNQMIIIIFQMITVLVVKGQGIIGYKVK